MLYTSQHIYVYTYNHVKCFYTFNTVYVTPLQQTVLAHFAGTCTKHDSHTLNTAATQECMTSSICCHRFYHLLVFR